MIEIGSEDTNILKSKKYVRWFFFILEDYEDLHGLFFFKFKKPTTWYKALETHDVPNFFIFFLCL